MLNTCTSNVQQFFVNFGSKDSTTYFDYKMFKDQLFTIISKNRRMVNKWMFSCVITRRLVPMNLPVQH